MANGALGPAPLVGDVISVDVKGVGKLDFPASMPPNEIKDYLDRTYGPNKPRSDIPLLQDLAGAVTEPLTHLKESVKKPHPYGAPTLQDALSILGLAGAVPWGVAARATERAFEQGAAKVQDRDPRSTWPSTIAGFVGGGVGPNLLKRAGKRALGLGAGPKTPPAPRPPVTKPGPGGTARPRLRLDAEGYLTGAPRPVAPPVASGARPRVRFGPQGVQVPGLEGQTLSLGKPIVPRESAVGGVADFAGKLLSPVYSRMEALGPEGFEASRLLRRVLHDTMGRTARDVQPLVSQISKLTKGERDQLYKFLHLGEAPPANSTKVLEAAKAFQGVFGEGGILPGQMVQAGMGRWTREGGRLKRLGEFQPRQQFFPLEYPGAFKAKVAERANFRQQLAEQMLREGKAKTLADAHRTIKQFIEGRKMGKERPSPGEFIREAEVPGFITDPAEAVMLRGHRTSQRLAEIEHLGHKDARLTELVEKLRAQDPQKAEELRALVDIAMGGNKGWGGSFDSRLGTLARGARSAQAFFKLPLAIIPNLSQTVWTSFRTDAASTFGAMAKLLFNNKQALKDARELGAYTDIASRQIMAEYASGVGERALNTILKPFNAVEKFNRTVAANAGLNYARRLEKAVELHQPKDAARLFRELRRLGFADDEARLALATKRFAPDQHPRIAREIVDQTQFIPSKGGRSEFFNSEIGATLGQFKTFSMNLARMLNRTVLDEIRAGNPRPAIKLLFYAGVPMQLAGEIVADMRAGLTGRTRPSLQAQWGMRMIENFASVGALGIATDFMFQVTQGIPVTQFLGGPTVDDINKLVQRVVGFGGAVASGSGAEVARQGTELGRFAARRIPYVGPVVTAPHTEMLPPTSPGPRAASPRDTPADIMGLSRRSAAKARLKEHELRMQQRRRWQRY